MKKSYRLLGKKITLLIITASAVSCAVSPFINVNYKLSEPSHIPGRQQVYVDFKDYRSDRTFLGKEAQSHFKYFNGRFHLFIDHKDGNKEYTGSYDLKTIFKEALGLRLRNQGVQVVKAKSENSIVMEVELKKFALELIGNNWITSIAYSAQLVHVKGACLVENISVTAERYKIWGRKEAEKTLSEAVSDAVNKLDFQHLFEKCI
jgi:hypothetical protein